MLPKPQINAQLMKASGLSRPGGMASRGSTSVPASKGKGFASMENMLLKSKKPNPKALSANPKPGRQYSTSVAGEVMGGMKPKSDMTPTTTPTGLRRVQKNGRNAMSWKKGM
jgi:hypothetical protein